MMLILPGGQCVTGKPEDIKVLLDLMDGVKEVASTEGTWRDGIPNPTAPESRDGD